MPALGVTQELNLKITSVDSKKPALAAALKAFKSKDATQKSATVLSVLRSIVASVTPSKWTGTITAVSNAVPTIASGYTHAQKLAVVSNNSLAISNGLDSSMDLVYALDIYFAVIAYNNVAMTYLNSKTADGVKITQTSGQGSTSSYTWSFSADGLAAPELVFTPGATVEYSVTAASKFADTNKQTSVAATGSLKTSVPVADGVLAFTSVSGNGTATLSNDLLLGYGLDLENETFSLTLQGAKISYGPLELTLSSDNGMLLDKMGTNAYDLATLFGSTIAPDTYGLTLSAFVSDPLFVLANGNFKESMIKYTEPALVVSGRAPQPSLVGVAVPKASGVSTGEIRVKLSNIPTSALNSTTVANFKLWLVDASAKSLSAFKLMTDTNKDTYLTGLAAGMKKDVPNNANGTGINYIPNNTTVTDPAYKYSEIFTSLVPGKSYYLVAQTDAVAPGVDSAYLFDDNSGANYVPFMDPLAPAAPALAPMKDGSLKVTFSPPTNDGLGKTNGMNIASYKLNLYLSATNVMVSTYQVSAPVVVATDAPKSITHMIPAAAGTALVPKIGTSYYATVSAVDKEGDSSLESGNSGNAIPATSVAFNASNIVSNLQRETPITVTGYINFMQTGARVTNILIGWMAVDPNNASIFENRLVTVAAPTITNGQYKFTITLADAKEQLTSFLLVATDDMGVLIYENVDSLPVV